MELSRVDEEFERLGQAETGSSVGSPVGQGADTLSDPARSEG